MKLSRVLEELGTLPSTYLPFKVIGVPGFSRMDGFDRNRTYQIVFLDESEMAPYIGSIVVKIMNDESPSCWVLTPETDVRYIDRSRGLP